MNAAIRHVEISNFQYDILTYLVMLKAFHAGAALFQTGWFVESLATQTLVVHIIRSRHSVLRSRASAALWLTTLAAVGVGIMMPHTSVGSFFGLSPLPPVFFMVLLGMVAAYLLVVEVVKRWFYARFGWQPGLHRCTMVLPDSRRHSLQVSGSLVRQSHPQRRTPRNPS